MSGSKGKSFINDVLSDTRQLTRIVILTGVLLIVSVVSFASYYYYDRYYQPQPKVADLTIEQAEQAFASDPTNVDKRLALAEVYMVNRRFDDALALANEVMEAYPDNQRAWLVVGVANALGGNPQAAVEPLQKFVDANKDTEMPGLNKTLQSAAYYLGDSYLQLGQPDKAVPPLELVVEWSKTDADAMYKLGMAYLGMERFEDAVTLFQSATIFVPNYTEAYEGMAQAFEGLNDMAYADYARGMVAYSKKDYDTALPLLLKVAEAVPDFVPVFDGLGLTYEGMGDLQNAKSSYEMALQLFPDDFTASTGLQRVEALINK